jgi:hypothetical protein
VIDRSIRSDTSGGNITELEPHAVRTDDERRNAWHHHARRLRVSVSVCPAENVHAPIERVWSLLAEPDGLDAWWDARIVSADPPGPLASGQHLVARARGALPLRFTLDVTSVDPVQHRVQITVRFLFGIVDHATLSATVLGPDRCHVQYG